MIGSLYSGSCVQYHFTKCILDLMKISCQKLRFPVGNSHTPTPKKTPWSMISNARMMGISCEGLTSKNYAALLESSDIKVLFVSPEVLKISAVSTALLAHRKDFGLKCIDEVHLGMLSIYK